MEKLSELIKKGGFEVAGVVLHEAFISDKIKQLGLSEGYEFLVLPRSQVKGSASAYTIYKKFVGK